MVTISGSLLDGICWRQALAGFVENHARQRAGVLSARRCPLHTVPGKHRLDIVPQRLVDDRRMFAGLGIALVCCLATVNAVLEDQIKRPTGEPLAPILGAVGSGPPLAPYPCDSKLFS